MTRNVYAHVAATYDAQTSKWPKPSGVCTPPPFDVYCKDPTVLGRIGNMFRCSPNSWEQSVWRQEFAAVEPQHLCLVGTGGLVADFLIR